MTAELRFSSSVSSAFGRGNQQESGGRERKVNVRDMCLDQYTVIPIPLDPLGGSHGHSV